MISLKKNKVNVRLIIILSIFMLINMVIVPFEVEASYCNESSIFKKVAFKEDVDNLELREHIDFIDDKLTESYIHTDESNVQDLEETTNNESNETIVDKDEIDIDYINKIKNSIDSLELISDENRDKKLKLIEDIKNIYLNLSENEKKLVSNYNKLIEIEDKYKNINQNHLDYKIVLSNVNKKIKKNYLKSPYIGSVGGEWAVLTIARNGNSDEEFKQTYLSKLNEYISSIGLDDIGRNKYTEYSRITLALSSLGIDAENFSYAGKTYNIVSKLLEKEKVIEQGINGPTFALLAIDSKPYFKDNNKIREEYINYILDQQNDDGGWSLYGKSDPDVTAMVLQSLAKYKDKSNDIKKAIDLALDYLKDVQDKDRGGYISWNQYVSESTAQVLVALTELQIDPEEWKIDSGKNLVEALLDFYNEDKFMFGHTLNDSSNYMATEQASYALVSLYRYKNGKNTLYDMSDAFTETETDNYTKEDLIKIIEKAKRFIDKKDDYEPDSFNSFKKSYDYANIILDKEIVTIFEINNAYNDLNISMKFLIEKDDKPSAPTPIEPTGGYAKISVKDPGAKKGQKKVYFEEKEMKIKKGETAFSLLERTGLNLRTSRHPVYSGVYVEAIEDFGEFDDGPLSGWMYRVNGKFPDYSSSLYKIKDGDILEWLYTRELGEDIGGGFDKTGNSLTSGINKQTAYYKPDVDIANDTGYLYIKYRDIKDNIIGSKVNKENLIIEPRIKDNVTNIRIEFTEEALDEIRRQAYGDLILKFDGIELEINKEALRQIIVNAKSEKLEFIIEKLNLKNQNFKNIEVDKGYNIYILGDNSKKIFNIEESIAIKINYINDKNNKLYIYVDDTPLTIDFDYVISDESINFNTNRFGRFIFGNDMLNLEGYKIDYLDVKSDDWFYDSVKYVTSTGLLKGYKNKKFYPHKELTRGMLVKILYRIENSPEVGSYKNTFVDVKDGNWYTDSVLWANKSNIVLGYQDQTFRPNSVVSREELVTILYRYSNFKNRNLDNLNFNIDSMLESYLDSSEISEWAVEPFLWANSNKLIKGKGSNILAPKDVIKRSEISAMLERFLKSE